MTATTFPTQATVTTREVAQAAREYARQKGHAVGTRGRLSADLFVEFFLAQPKTAREVAKAHDIPVSTRGRLSAVDAETLALVVR